MGNHPRAVTPRMSPEPDLQSYPDRYRPLVQYPHTGPHAMVRWWSAARASRVILSKTGAGLKPALRRVLESSLTSGSAGGRKIKIEEVAAVRLVAPPEEYVRVYARAAEQREFVYYWREVSVAAREILLKGGELPGGFGECPVHRIGRWWGGEEKGLDPLDMEEPLECCFFGVRVPAGGPDYWGRFRALRGEWHRAETNYRSSQSLTRPQAEKAPAVPRPSPGGLYDPAEGPLYAMGNRGFQGGLEIWEVNLEAAPRIEWSVSFYFQRTPGAPAPSVEPEWVEQTHREAAQRKGAEMEFQWAMRSKRSEAARAAVRETFWRAL